MKTKTKIIVWGSFIFFIVVLAIVLAFTLFGLKHIELDFKNQTSKFTSNESQLEVITSAEFKMSECVFFVNKKEYILKIEQANPYIKVINIETKFPNKLVIHCAEREELYSLKISDDKYFICDSEFKLLNILSNITGSNTTLLSGEYDLRNKNANVGDYIDLGIQQEMFQSIPVALKINNRTFAEQKFLFKVFKIEYNSLSRPCLIIIDNNNFNIEIKYMDENLIEKFQCLFSCYSLIDADLYQTQKLVIQENFKNEIIAIRSPLT